MKKLLILPVLLFVAMPMMAQDALNFEGIGKFKILKTTVSIIDSLKDELNVKEITIVNDRNYEYKHTKGGKAKIIRFVADTTKDENDWPIYATTCPEYSVYFITSVNIANIEFKNIYLTFRHDSLISFQSDYSEDITKAMELKYGKTKDDIKKSETTCSFSGKSYTLEDETLTCTWENPKISIYYTIMMYYSYSGCDKRYLSFFTYSLKDYIKHKSACEKEIKTRIEKKKDEEQKKKLNDF